MIVTSFTCPEWLRRKGLLLDGGPMPEPCPVIDRHPTIAEIQHVVAEFYRLPLIEMKSARRAREVAWPRQIAMYLSKRLTVRSLPEIGRHFGGRDHTTVIHSVKQTEKRLLSDPDLPGQVIAILERLEPLTHRVLPWVQFTPPSEMYG